MKIRRVSNICLSCSERWLLISTAQPSIDEIRNRSLPQDSSCGLISRESLEKQDRVHANSFFPMDTWKMLHPCYTYSFIRSATNPSARDRCDTKMNTYWVGK